MIYFLLSFIIVALVLGWCLAKMAKGSNDDCMTEIGHQPPVKELPVEDKDIPWGELRS